MTLGRFARLAAIPFLIGIVSCSGKPKLDQVQPGMTEPEVVKQLGKPESVAVQGRIKVYRYHSYWGLEHHDDQWWFVRFVDGRVESFGHMGDFDSTKDPTQRVLVDQKMDAHSTTQTTGQQNAGQAAPFDLATELRKLDQMKKDGLLTDEEYKSLRQRAIDKAKGQ